MKIRTRLILAFLVLAGAGFYQYVNWFLDELRPHYLASMEESMVDTATLLASYVSLQLEQAGSPTADLRAAFDRARQRRFEARIYEMTKHSLGMRVYITDQNGIVLFDSNDGKDEGKDYSRWNDVWLTLRGEYGARATALVEGDPRTEVLYVASPVYHNGEIAGVLTVGKPARSVALFVQTATWRILMAGAVLALSVAVFGMAISFWFTRPISVLMHYARAVRDGRRVSKPRLSGEIGQLAQAFEEMRTALEGKKYVEDYVQTLTHQMKSPLSAIRGAAELLQEDMPRERQRQFLENLRTETTRLQDLIDRMLQLAALENRTEPRDVETIDVAALAAEVLESMQPALAGRHVEPPQPAGTPARIQGEPFLIRQALVCLVQNAAEFTGDGGHIAVGVANRDGMVRIVVEDDGPGVPEYALGRAFERFFSLQRPGAGRRSSGLGLAFVREVAALHRGAARLENRPEGGARATLLLPESCTPAR